MNKYVLIAFCFLLFAVCFPLYSQEQQEDDEIHTEYEQDSSTLIYIINSFVFNIDGITRSYALINKANFIHGEEITGLANLERYIRNKQQLLYNERVLESVRIEHTVGTVQEDGKYPVDLVIHVKDTWNIIAIPRPQYTSNSGFDITVKARDYNFLGTMSPLRLDVGYQRDIEGKNFFTLMLDADIPFRAFGFNWNLDFDNYFGYRPDMDKPFYYKNITGISVEFPFKQTTLTAGFSESFIVNEENPLRYREEYGYFQEGFYMSSIPFVSWKIPISPDIFDLGELNYYLKLSAVFNHEFPQWSIADFRKGPILNFSHNFDFGRIDWIGNFQNGLSASVGNEFSYNFYYLKNDNEPLGSNIRVSVTGHKRFNNFIGISSRLMYRHWFFSDYHDEAGDVIRGVIDNSVLANYMLSFNLDIPVRVLRFRPSVWFNKYNKFFRIFDFDLHLSPIVDIALYNNPKEQTTFSFHNMLLTAGMEIIIFPERWRSLFLRISYGRNFSFGDRSNTSEIFIGTEFHY